MNIATYAKDDYFTLKFYFDRKYVDYWVKDKMSILKINLMLKMMNKDKDSMVTTI